MTEDVRDSELLRTVAWLSLHEPAVEHVALWRRPGGYQVRGYLVGAYEGQPLRANYRLEVDPNWRTLRVAAAWSMATNTRQLRLRRDADGTWDDGNGVRADLADCVDIDLAWTPLTNTLPIRRLGLAVGEGRELAVAYIEPPGLIVRPDWQRYTRLAADRWRFESPAFNFTADLTVDQHGLVVDYPPLFRRIGQWDVHR